MPELPFSPDALTTAAILLVIAVAGFDLGMAFLMRLTREASAESELER